MRRLSCDPSTPSTAISAGRLRTATSSASWAQLRSCFGVTPGLCQRLLRAIRHRAISESLPHETTAAPAQRQIRKSRKALPFRDASPRISVSAHAPPGRASPTLVTIPTGSGGNAANEPQPGAKGHSGTLGPLPHRDEADARRTGARSTSFSVRTDGRTDAGARGVPVLAQLTPMVRHTMAVSPYESYYEEAHHNVRRARGDRRGSPGNCQVAARVTRPRSLGGGWLKTLVALCACPRSLDRCQRETYGQA